MIMSIQWARFVFILTVIGFLTACGSGDPNESGVVNSKPIVTLLGTDPMSVEVGGTFTDPGAAVTDDVDTDLTAIVTGSVDTAVPGSYILTYDATDSDGNAAVPVTRTVNVMDTTAPIITLIGNNPLSIAPDSIFVDPGASVSDNIDSGLTAVVSGSVDTSLTGTYVLTYNVSDNVGNAAIPVTRNVIVGLTGPIPTLTIGMKQLQFSWPAVPGTDHYRILENPDGVSGFSVIPAASSISTASYTLEIPVHLTNWLSAQYIVEACDVDELYCAGSMSQSLSIINSIAATGYFKASNTGANDRFKSVALSGDGTTLAVGANYESSSATGINNISPGQLDNSADKAGAVYLFVKSGNTWVQQAYIKASNTGTNDYFGSSVTLSDDGNTLAVGASQEKSLSTGINSVSNNNGVVVGAVYLYIRSGTSWTQEAYIKASNADTGDNFGASVKLSNDGNTLAVGAYREGSDATGINGSQANAISDSGAVYIYVRSGVTWTQQAYIKASNTDARDNFGFGLALNGDGNTLAVGAFGEASADSGINVDETDNAASKAGAVYVFVRSGESWAQQAYIKVFNPDGGNVFSVSEGDYFGYSVALSDSGDTLAVGAYEEGSSSIGIDGDQLDNSAPKTGAAYVFTRSGTTWAQQAYIKASHTDTYYNWFGYSIAISSDGNTLSVGAYAESNSAKGVGGNEYESVAAQAGAVYVYQRSATTWAQKSYVKAPNTDAYDWFGTSLSLSNDGNTMAVGAVFEDSSSTGINGDKLNAAAGNSGAVYLY